MSVKGRVRGDSEKPLPVTAIELTFNAAVPLEVTVTVCVAGKFSATLPNDSVVAFTVSSAAAPFNRRESFRDVPPVVAVRVTDWFVVTAAIFAVNVALFAVAGTLTELGIFTDPLLLASATLTPLPGAVPDKVTMQESARDPVIDVLAHESALTVGATEVPVPLRLTTSVRTLVEIVNCPLTALTDVGLN